ncbi:MAG: carbohydrate ABC transporter permease [Pseudomonadota bacterium]
MSRNARRLLLRIAFYVLVIFIVIYTVFPFYWAINSSLKAGTDLFAPDFLPPSPAWTNYVSVFEDQPFALNILNSVYVSGVTVIISLFLAVTAAYALGRIKFSGRGVLLLVVLSVSMFPQIAVLSGLYEVMRWLGLIQRLESLIISYVIFTLPFTVWILTTFMRELPKELEEAAIVDGASPWQTISRVFLPLLGPALATTGLLAFIAAWNEFLFALTFVGNNNETQTIPVAIANFSGASEFELPWGGIMAASVIVTVPLIVLVLIFQRMIVSGLTAGAVKG